MRWMLLLIAKVFRIGNQELLDQYRYAKAENRILRSQFQGPISFTDADRARLARLAKQSGHAAGPSSAGGEKPDPPPAS
jgi:hypothetical protein